MSSIQRITGMNSGLDVDTLVKQSLKPYQNRIDKETQNKKVYEYQQEQYKQIMSDASSFYDKYFDVLKTGNLLSASTYQTQTYKSADDTKVTARGLAGATLDNYSVNVTQLASKASVTLDIGSTDEKIIKIGSAEVKFGVVPNGLTTVSNYNKAIETEKNRLNDLVKKGTVLDTDGKSVQTKLSDLSYNAITAKYSEFNNNVTFTATQFNQGGFSILNATTKNVEQSGVDKYLEATIKNSSGKVYAISTADKKTSNYVTIDNVEFNLKGVSNSTVSTPTGEATKAKPLTENDAGFEKIKSLSDLADVSLSLSNLVALTDSDGTPTIASDGTKTITTADGLKKTEISADGNTVTTTLTSADGNTVTTTKVEVNGSTKTTTTTKNEKNSGTTKITTDTKTESTSVDSKTGATTTNTVLQESVVNGTATTTKSTETNVTTALDGTTKTTKATKNIDADGATTTTVTNMTNTTTNNITTKITIPYDGASPISKEMITDYSTSPASKRTTTMLIAGKDSTIKEEVESGGTKTITTTAKQALSNGSTYTTTEISVNGTVTDSNTTDLVINSDGSTTKTVTIQKDATKTTTANNYSNTSLAGGTDVSGLKDKIVSFINDYNNLIKEINTKLWEKRDKDFMPLTDEQKKSMTESQITAWEKKAQTGLLRKDSILEKITGEMKSAMSSVMSGTGVYLEKIGITHVEDYADKNGMFTIDENKLTTALEENGGNVEDLFIRSSDVSSSQGIIKQLRDVLKTEFKTSKSDLAKKAGYDGSTAQTDNFLTKSINEKTNLLKQLNTQLSTKENALYKKYSNLETAMERLNSQQSSLAKLLGQ